MGVCHSESALSAALPAVGPAVGGGCVAFRQRLKADIPPRLPALLDFSLLRETFRTATALVFPHYCPGCRSFWPDGRGWLCPDCWAALPLAGRGLWAADRALCERLFVAYHYSDAARELVHRMKFYGREDIALGLGEAAANRMIAREPAPPVEAIVPVPLHPVRVRERGYDQDLTLAKGAARVLGLPVRSDLIRRVRNTPAQSRLSDAARRLNLRGAFAPNQHRRQSVPKAVLLVDDVIHTGSTVRECIASLLEMGVGDLFVLAACG